MITVIGIIIDVLDQAGDIVHVDLRTQTVTSNRALARALDTGDDKWPAAVRLRGLEAFVSIRGLFRATDRTPAVTTFDPRPPVGAIRNRMAIVEAPEPQFGSEWRLPGTQQIEAEIEGWG